MSIIKSVKQSDNTYWSYSCGNLPCFCFQPEGNRVSPLLTNTTEIWHKDIIVTRFCMHAVRVTYSNRVWFTSEVKNLHFPSSPPALPASFSFCMHSSMSWGRDGGSLGKTASRLLPPSAWDTLPLVLPMSESWPEAAFAKLAPASALLWTPPVAGNPFGSCCEFEAAKLPEEPFTGVDVFPVDTRCWSMLPCAFVCDTPLLTDCFFFGFFSFSPLRYNKGRFSRQAGDGKSVLQMYCLI